MSNMLRMLAAAKPPAMSAGLEALMRQQQPASRPAGVPQHSLALLCHTCVLHDPASNEQSGSGHQARVPVSTLVGCIHLECNGIGKSNSTMPPPLGC